MKDRFIVKKRRDRGRGDAKDDSLETHVLGSSEVRRHQNECDLNRAREVAAHPLCRPGYRDVILQRYLPYLEANSNKTLSPQVSEVLYRCSCLARDIDNRMTEPKPIGPVGWTVETFDAVIVRAGKAFAGRLSDWERDPSMLPKRPPPCREEP